MKYDAEQLERRLSDTYAELDDKHDLNTHVKMALLRVGEAYTCADKECGTITYGYDALECRKCGGKEWAPDRFEVDDELQEFIEEHITSWPKKPITYYDKKEGVVSTHWALTKHWESPMYYADNTRTYILTQRYVRSDDSYYSKPNHNIVLGRTRREVIDTYNGLNTILSIAESIHTEEE